MEGIETKDLTIEVNSEIDVSRCPDMEGIETREESVIFVQNNVSSCPDMEGIETS